MIKVTYIYAQYMITKKNGEILCLPMHTLRLRPVYMVKKEVYHDLEVEYGYWKIEETEESLFAYNAFINCN